MQPRVSAPERTKVHATCTSWAWVPIRWNSSVSTASEVSKGTRSCANASAHARCHRSFGRSMARIAPVSIKALAAIALLQPLAHGLPDLLGTVRVAHGKGAEAFRRRGMQSRLLSFVIAILLLLHLQPLFRDAVQHFRHRRALHPRLGLQPILICGSTRQLYTSVLAMHYIVVQNKAPGQRWVIAAADDPG